jgi:two-component system, cell cycle response regulator
MRVRYQLRPCGSSSSASEIRFIAGNIARIAAGFGGLSQATAHVALKARTGPLKLQAQMTDQHPAPPAICPVGFSQGELTTLEIFFRISQRRPPGWLIAPRQADAQVLLLNAAGMNIAAYCRNLSASAPQIVIVGPSDFGTGHRFIERPIKLNAMLNLINEVHDDVLPDTVAAPLNAADWAVLSETVPAPLAPLAPAAPTPFTARPPPAMMAGQKSASPPTTPALARSTSRRMLVVDDNDIALTFMSALLKRNNFEFQLAKSGEEALSIVASSRFDLVFLDVTMAGMDGYQTCRSIKKAKYPSGRPPIIIMLTSRAGTFDKIKGTMAGCDAYLTKPLNVKQLAVLLAKFDLSPFRQKA